MTMSKMTFGAAALALLLMPVGLAPAQAGERTRVVEDGPQFSQHPKSRYYRGARVRGYVKRRGGYSYSYVDGVLDFRDTSILRDNQTIRHQAQPFDSDFFFDSGLSRYHSAAPY